MDAVEFLKARSRMCNDNVCEGDCPLFHCCNDRIDDNMVKLVSLVEQWAKEHPVKTRQSELLKLFPNTPRKSDGCVDMCPCEVGCLIVEDDDGACKHNEDGVGCNECKRDFWLKEIE